jgi:hypothetical protein
MLVLNRRVFDHYQDGGHVTEDGPAIVHKGETVLPAGPKITMGKGMKRVEPKEGTYSDKIKVDPFTRPYFYKHETTPGRAAGQMVKA